MIIAIDFVLSTSEVELGWPAFAVIAHYQRHHGITGCELVYRWHREESGAILANFEVDPGRFVTTEVDVTTSTDVARQVRIVRRDRGTE